MRLAGLRINPKNYSDATARYINNINCAQLILKMKCRCKVCPEHARISHLRFRPMKIRLRILPIARSNYGSSMSPAPKKKNSSALNASVGVPYIWFADSGNLLVKALSKKSACANQQQNLTHRPRCIECQWRQFANRTWR